MAIKRLKFLAKTSLVCVLLVVLAGSLVRTTGSGMGCPDWPKCFGYYIPPTKLSELTFHVQNEYKRGQIIIVNKVLKVCKNDFTSENIYNESNWLNYTKHDYAIFNPYHTWIEYINRLIGAFTGLPVLLLFAGSLFIWKKSKTIPILCLSVLILLGIVAYMGKLVVDGNLIPNQITLHMMGAVLLVFLLLVIINKLNSLEPLQGFSEPLNKSIAPFLIASVIVTLFQIIMGTKVREQIDFIDRKLGLDRSVWIQQLDYHFDWHRTFAWVVLLLNGFIVFRLMKLRVQPMFVKQITSLVLVEIFIGVFMSYFEIPNYMQPAHLVAAFLLFAVQSNFLLAYQIKK